MQRRWDGEVNEQMNNRVTETRMAITLIYSVNMFGGVLSYQTTQANLAFEDFFLHEETSKPS